MKATEQHFPEVLSITSCCREYIQLCVRELNPMAFPIIAIKQMFLSISLCYGELVGGSLKLPLNYLLGWYELGRTFSSASSVQAPFCGDLKIPHPLLSIYRTKLSRSCNLLSTCTPVVRYQSAHLKRVL